jgi:hypothetical protein
VKGGLFLNVVVTESTAIFELFASKDQALLVRGDAARDELISWKTQTLDIPLLVLNLGLDIVDGVRGLNLEGDGFARKAVKMTLNVE